MKTGAELVLEERERQVSEEGYSAEHDRSYVNGELALAAIAYAAPRPVYLLQTNDSGIHFTDPWIWDAKWDKRKSKPRLRRVVVAAAILCAEVDRLLAIESRLAALEEERTSQCEHFLGSPQHRRYNELFSEIKALEDQLK